MISKYLVLDLFLLCKRKFTKVRQERVLTMDFLSDACLQWSNDEAGLQTPGRRVQI